MARPITWQNVQGNNPIDALKGIQVAQQMGSGAFDQFGKIIQGVQATDEANWEQVKKNNTQGFLNKLYSVTGADQFKAMQDSGELQAMVAKNGAQIDQAAVRAATDGRLSTLQQRETQGMAFKNAVADQANIDLDRKEEPITYQVKALLAKGDLAGAKPLIAGLSARGQANTLALADARERELLMRTRGDKEWGWKEEEVKYKTGAGRVLEEAQKRASINASNAGANASNASAKLTNYTIEQNQNEAAKATQRARLEAALKGNLYADGEYTDRDSPAILDLLVQGKVGGTGSDAPLKQAKVLARINQMARDGVEITTKDGSGNARKVNVPIPLSVLKSTLLGTENTVFSWNEGWADDFEQKLKARLNGDDAAKKRAISDYENLLSIRRLNAEATPGVKVSKK